MCNNYSQYQILDDILDCYDLGSGNEAMTDIQFGDILGMITDRGIIVDDYYTWALYPAIEKLRKEKYLRLWKDDIKTTDEGSTYQDWYYTLTFEGLLLIKSGGYVKMISDVNRENERVKALEVSSEKQGETLNRLTGWIFAVTIPIALYAVFQMLDWLCLHPYFSYWGHLFFSCPHK